MRHPRLLLPALLALATAACSNQKPAYYVTDSVTGQRVATGPQSVSYSERGLFSSDAPRTSGSYAYAPTQTQGNTSGRGLFNSDVFSSPARAPAYVYPAQPQPPQTYSYQPPPQQAYARQAPATMYQPPQPAQPAYAQQPQQQQQYPQAQPGYYAERYRWY